MSGNPYGITEFFRLGMKRDTGEGDLEPWITRKGPGLVLNLGAGNQRIPGTVSLGLDQEPPWTAPVLPYLDASVDGIHAYHFFEHLSGDTAIAQLAECQRVLKNGGWLNILVPLAGSHMSMQDITHKSFWTSETLQQLFANRGYDPYPDWVWQFEVTFQMIAGLNERNLALMIQLVKDVDL